MLLGAGGSYVNRQLGGSGGTHHSVWVRHHEAGVTVVQIIIKTGRKIKLTSASRTSTSARYSYTYLYFIPWWKSMVWVWQLEFIVHVSFNMSQHFHREISKNTHVFYEYDSWFMWTLPVTDWDNQISSSFEIFILVSSAGILSKLTCRAVHQTLMMQIQLWPSNRLSVLLFKDNTSRCNKKYIRFLWKHFIVTWTTADVLFHFKPCSLEMYSESLGLRDQMESKVPVRSQKSLTVACGRPQIGVVWYTVCTTFSHFSFILHFHFTL